FAASQARSQRRQGKSTMAIRQRLRQHALDDAAIATALRTADADHQDAELAAAIHFARRRRLGPFFQGVADERTRHRHMGSLARAGFSMTICRAILDTNGIDDLEGLEHEAIQTRQPDE
ncbi:MAG: RecX family transcriptional regulator, partial [Candidatus Puniceispirillaceae bacterium]